MLGNITSDLNNLLTDLCPHNRDDHHAHRDEPRSKLSTTILSEDTLGKDSFLSSAGNTNTSRTRGHHRLGSDPSLVSSLDNTDHCDCDSVDSGHDGRCRTGPSPLVFDPNHFISPPKHNTTTSPVTIRVDVSSSMEESRQISTLERLVKTNTIWLLSSLSRAGAVHLLKDRCTGTFIVRKSSQPNSLALSVQNRMSGHATVDHYLIEGTDFGFRLQGSSHFFQSVPYLISFYVENKEDIPYVLQLPASIQDSRSLRELTSLALLGQDFWQSPISRRSPTPSLEALSHPSIHKSFSEPIDIQQPIYPPPPPSDPNFGQIHNTLPSRSPPRFSNFVQSHTHMDRYFEQRVHQVSSGEHHHPDISGSEDMLNQIQPPDHSIINMVRQTISVSSSNTHSQNAKTPIINHQDSLWPVESAPPFPVPLSSAAAQFHSRDNPLLLRSHSSIPQHHQHPSHPHQGQPVFMSTPSLVSSFPLPPATNSPSPHGDQFQRSAANGSSSSIHASCQTSSAIHAPTVDITPANEKQSGKRRSWTHPPQAESKPKSSLYSTMNLGLLEIPENRYFKSSLADKLSDYEDVWKNNCDSDAPYASSKKIQDPRSVLDSKSRSNRQNRHNPMFAKDGRRKVLKKTIKDTMPSREKEPHSPRDSVTGGRTGLTALERARLIAGSTSDEESALLPIAHVKGIQRMENMFNAFSKSELQTQATTSLSTTANLSPNSPSSPTVRSDETVHNGSHTDSILFSDSPSPHQIKSFTSHSVDFNSVVTEEARSSVCTSRKDSPPKRVFKTTMSVIMSESTSSPQPAVAKNSKQIPGPITNLSKIKSSSESSIATVSSPLYLEPADAVRLRDRNGKAVTIHVRRRLSAPAVNTGKGQLSKLSQQTRLETIFSPTEANIHNGKPIVQSRFVFDNISPDKLSKNKTAITRSITSNSAPEHTNLQRKHSWKDRLNRLKLGTKVLTQNLTPPSVLNNRHHNMMSKQRPILENLILNYNDGQYVDQHVNSPASSSLGPAPFPLDISSSQSAPIRASIFSDSSTVQDLISSVHPELAIKPIVPQSSHVLHGVQGRLAAPMSEYDNLAGYRGSTHSSQGTIYSPPWESGSAHKFLQPRTPPQQLPPATMDLNERVQRWQLANSSYHEQDRIDCPNKSSNQTKRDSSDQQRVSKDGKCRSKVQNIPETLDDDLHITESYEFKSNASSFLNASFNGFPAHLHLQLAHAEQDKAIGSYDNYDQSQRQPVKTSAVPSLSHQHSMEGSFPQLTNPSLKSPSSPTPLSSHHPDVVNCHHAPLSPSTPVLGKELSPFTATMKDTSQGQVNQEADQTKAPRSAGGKIRDYIFRLSGDNQTMFGSTIGNFIQCTIESQESNPLHVLRNVRQFMTGIKNYLVKHGEGQLEDLIERERTKLSSNEILNIDAIIEQALHVCVLKPLKSYIYKLFVNHYSNSGSLQTLSRNIKYARSRSAQELGVKPGLKLPDAADMEVIGHHLNLMQKSYSPLQKLNSLLKATSAIYHCVQGKDLLPSRGPMSLGADDFLPMLIFVIVHSGLVAAEIEADFMWGLLQPSLLTGEGGYYLTTLSSAVLILKNFQDTHQITPGQMEVRLPAISDMQGFLKIAIPNVTHGSINWKTLPVRPSMNTRDVCAMVAHKFKITNPQDYGLFLLCDGEEMQMADSECPQLIKGDNQVRNKDCYFAFKRLDATIAWPPYMKHSPVTVLED